MFWSEVTPPFHDTVKVVIYFVRCVVNNFIVWWQIFATRLTDIHTYVHSSNVSPFVTLRPDLSYDNEFSFRSK
jgi:hypothetical protein